MTAAEYRQALDALPFGKRLPGAVVFIDPSDDPNDSVIYDVRLVQSA